MKNRGTVTQFWLPLVMLLTLVAPTALGQITIQSAVYGKNQTAALGFVGATCYQRNATDLTSAVNSYCNEHSVGDACTYTVPWPTSNQDPGFGCYKNFKATYQCTGFKNPRTIEFGGIIDEAANQVATFNCAPMGIGTVSVKKIVADSQSFTSNGDVRTAWYSITADSNGGADYEGSINVIPRVKSASVFIRDLDRSKNYLNCDSSPRVTTNSDGSAVLQVEYQTIVFSNVSYLPEYGHKVVSGADVNFALKVNNSSCSGAFNYSESRQDQIEAAFFIVVNNIEVPLGISFRAPQSVTPDFRMVPMGRVINRNDFSSAITINRDWNFQYDFLYRNAYGLPAAVDVSCTFGKSGPVQFTTDAVTGRLQVKGSYTVTKAGRDSNGSMTWNVSTSLTGDNPAFTLISGQNIGSVECKSSDASTAKYTQNLGDW